MAVRIMSDKELARFEVLRDLDHERLTAQAAADILGLSRRQTLRLLKAYRTCGVNGLVSKQRGRRSNRRKPENVRAEALAIIRDRYADFGPTLAAEKLRELHDICLGRETIRLWMAEEGLWTTRKKRRPRVYQPRYRRDCVGELIQIDVSEHRWFEGRGPMCTLLVFIDDATSRLMHLQFVETESTFSYFAATKAYLEAHGKPVAFYSDKHSVFRVAKPGVTGDGMTQFGRALSRLKIEIICANSSQAKGRVERANKTLQDRLVKELRLSGISTMEAGNTFLPAFVADYNKRFGKAPANSKDLHRPMSPRDQLDDEFTWQEERTLSQSLTLQYDKVLFILEPSETAQAAIGKRVTVVDYPDGRIAIRYKGEELAYRTFDKIRKVNQAAVVENKRLGSLLEMIKAYQDTQPPEKRSRKAPKRRDQTGHMFNVG
ncbi:ISNCY family transposase [Asticcacaulis sp. DXS10W]|uniref:ISNCY family transposase n=1 Tax=Asticcacaulis currens TaxID=2984210 RepID=A0ABT5IGT7_9CAUL|nr:ISNCY family transposase [Asticcacaulis currens]MDC7695418.1 ISNCY family transposase [Asticcacaulis currens]